MENNINQEFNLQSEEMFGASQNQEAAKKTVGFWEFFGLIALFAIPVVGFIAAIVFLFAPKRKSLKNYAGAVLAWVGVRIALTFLILSILLSAFGNVIVPAINESLGTEFQTVGEVVGVAGGLTTQNYSKVIKALRPQLLEMMGEEYGPLLDELSKPKHNKLIKLLVNEEYDKLREELKSDKYPDLVAAMGQEKYDEFISELKKVTEGQESELFDGFKELSASLSIR